MAQEENTPRAVVVARGDAVEGDVTARTPSGMPDAVLVVMAPTKIVIIRVLRTYFQSLLGFLGATAIGVLPPVLGDPVDPNTAWSKIVTAAGLALFPAFISLIQNILELLAKADEKLPELRA